MIIAGLTGSIAMGKSATANQFIRRGIRVFDSDSVVHQLYAKGGDAVGAIAKLAPTAIVDHAVDRRLLSREIRNRPALLTAVEQAIHPLVRARQEAFLQQARAEGRSLVILDIPMLFETGRDRDVDKIIVVSTSPDIQRERAMKRPGMTEEKLNFILSRQVPDAEKRARADYIIDTSNSIDDSQRQVDLALSELIATKGY